MEYTHRPQAHVDRWRAVLPRVLFQAGVPPQAIDGFYTDADVDAIMHTYQYGLQPRPGLKEMLATLKAGGIEFNTCSNASPDRVRSFFSKAGIEIDDARVCDVTSRVGVKKPRLEVYRTLMEECERKNPGQVVIFGGERNSTQSHRAI